MSTLPGYRPKPGVTDPTMLPPFSSRRLSMRYFPIPAESDRLQAHLDEFFGFKSPDVPGMAVPAEIGVFRPAMPFVFVVAAHHDELAPDAEQGVVVQEESSIGFFAEWRRRERGKLVFKDWVWVNVLVLVDSELSVITGRSLWGWPKLHARSRNIPSPRARGGSGPYSIERLTALAPTPGFGSSREFHLDIDAGSGPSWSQGFMSMPPGLPWLRVVADWTGGAFGTWISALKLGLGAMENVDPTLLEKAFRRSATALCEFSPRSFIDTRVLSVKQFRDAASPERVCHQALISSKLETLAFRGAGILGEAAVMAGDMSGDYRVRVSRDPELELVDRLGLAVERDDDARDETIATLRPLFPFWIEIDAGYDRGKILGVRDASGHWSIPGAEASHAVGQRSVVEVPCRSLSSEETENPLGHDMESEALVLPLKANADRLRKTLTEYYGFNASPAEPYVYAVVEASRPSGMPRARPTFQLSLCVPILTEVGTAFVAPFEYSSDSRTALFAREVQGRETRLAEFEEESAGFLGSAGERRLLRVRSEFFSELGMSQASRQHTLFEVWRGAASRAVDGPSPALGVAYLTSYITARKDSPLRLNLLSLKQFRDAAEPERACYQTLVRSALELNLSSVHALEQSFELRIVRHPSVALSDALGLEVVSVSGSGMPVERLTAVAPFRVSGRSSWRGAATG